MPIFEITARYQMYLGPGNQINKGERLTMNIHTIGVQPVTPQRYGPVCILSSKIFVKSNKEDCFAYFRKYLYLYTYGRASYGHFKSITWHNGRDATVA